MEIEEGDQVWLKSASKACDADFKGSIICVSPRMTVETTFANGYAECVWWNGNEFLREKFKKAVLIKIP